MARGIKGAFGATVRKTTISVSTDLWERARRAALMHNCSGGVSELIREGLELRLQQLDQQAVTFEQAFRYAHGRDSTVQERLACYGGRVMEPGAVIPGPMAAHFSDAGALSHYGRSVWNRETATVVYRQRAAHQRAGVPMYSQVLMPPGWEEECRAREVVVAWEGVPVGEEEPGDVIG